MPPHDRDVFADHARAEAAVRQLSEGGFDMKKLSIASCAQLNANLGLCSAARSSEPEEQQPTQQTGSQT